MNSLISRIPNKYWAYLALSIWGGLCIIMLHKSFYGIEEGAARALLLVWSVVDNVSSPIIISGLPDFRAVYLLITGFFWPGNILAAKIATIFFMAAAVWSISTWRQLSGNGESALLASGLLLISPLVIGQIDSVSVAPFLLLTFALGTWSDKTYQESPQIFGGMYFAQMFLCMVSTTLHPTGLAYPLALLWSWHKNPQAIKYNYFFGIGVIFSVLFALLLTLGWHGIDWFTNPFISISNLLFGSSDNNDAGAIRWISGIGILFTLLTVTWKQLGNLWSDLLGRVLLIAFIIGLLAADETWNIIALTICLYWGFPLLLQTSENAADGFKGQRIVVLALIFVVSTLFMLTDKERYHKTLDGELAPRDNLIQTLVEVIKDNSAPAPREPPKPPLVASQWPGLTMLACKCGTFPLPPPAQDGQILLAMVRNINYLVFDPTDSINRSLANNFASVSAGKIETVALQKGGVILRVKNAPDVVAK